MKTRTKSNIPGRKRTYTSPKLKKIGEISRLTHSNGSLDADGMGNWDPC